MVTATNGTVTLRGRNGSRSLSIYISDVVAAYATINLNGQAGTGSDTFYIAQGDGVLSDVSITTGPTVMKSLVLVINGVSAGHVFDIISYVSTAPFRPPLSVPIRKGDKIQFVQA